jgi:phage-related protein
MAKEDSKSRIKWEGDSPEEIRSWPADVRQDIGGDLRRLEDQEQPLDSKSMGQVLPGVHEIEGPRQRFLVPAPILVELWVDLRVALFSKEDEPDLKR